MRRSICLSVCLSVCLLTTAALAQGWTELEPVGDGVEVTAGGCAAAGHGCVFVYSGEDDDYLYAYDVARAEWIDLDCVGSACEAGALAFETGHGRRLFFVSDGFYGDKDSLFTYWLPWDTVEYGFWQDPEPLPSAIGPGVGLAFVPASTSTPVLSGYLYLLCGGGSYSLLRRRYDRNILIPEIAGPMDGAQTKPDYTALDWRITSASATYDVQVDNSAGFGSPEVDTTVTCGELVIPNGKLSSYTTYYWRVRSTEGARTSGWSDVESFVTSATSATGGYSTFPPDDAEIAGDETYFDWPSVAYATAYELVVKPTTSGTPVLDETLAVSEYSSTDKLDCGDYQWKYRSKNRFNVWSSWSSWYDVNINFSWEGCAWCPSAISEGGALCFGHEYETGDSCLYAIVGNNSTSFYSYDPESDQWQGRASTQGQQRGGAALAAADGGAKVYAECGDQQGTDTLWCYDPDYGYWYCQTELPRLCDYGSALAWLDGDAYLVVAGDDEHNFYVYHTGDEEQERGTSGTCGTGVGLCCRPTRHGARVTCSIPVAGHVRATVVGPDGRMVAVLADRMEAAGEHELTWNGRDRAGGGVAAGVYFIRVETAGAAQTVKTVLGR